MRVPCSPLPVVLPLLAAGAVDAVARRPRCCSALLSVLTLRRRVLVTAAVLLRRRRPRRAPQVVQARRLGRAGRHLAGRRPAVGAAAGGVGGGAAGGARLRHRAGRRRRPAARPLAVFHPCYLVLAAGIAMAFLTGDLFNLFVAFEVMLVASYVLLTLGGGAAQVRAGMTYVVVSLLASVLFVTVVGLVYAATGTVNMADAARAAAGRARGRAGRARADDAGRLRHQGGDLPAVLLAARQLPDGAVAGHRRVRRAAHQGRRLRDHPHADAAVPGRARPSPRCCSCSPR